MRTTARGTSGAVDGAPPARSSGTSTSTVPATCTSGVRVVLLLANAEEQDAPVLSYATSSKPARTGATTSRPTTRRRQADGYGLVPNNLLWT